MKRQILHPTTIAEIKYLKRQGISPAFIGKFAALYYGVARSTVYRYVSENKDWYNQKIREQRLQQIQDLLCDGMTSAQIADTLDEPLKKVNKLIVDNGISVYKCR